RNNAQLAEKFIRKGSKLYIEGRIRSRSYTDKDNQTRYVYEIIADKIQLYPQELYEKGMRIISASTVRNHPLSLPPQIKSLNYLNNILAKIEARNSGCMEALMLNHQGYVTECTGDNIFMVKHSKADGLYPAGIRLITPPIYLGALKGITRQTIMEIAAAKKIPTEEKILTRHDLYNADEVFLTGTAAEVIPVVKIDGRVIGEGKPGKTTGLLLKAFHAKTRQDGVQY
ncbi:MAG: aminotransferase class IV, partial [Candidatus Omnitrophica bacterium]|nr:aminotransferase class IV [Candidatus Omnitrophota bacterium]